VPLPYGRIGGRRDSGHQAFVILPEVGSLSQLYLKSDNTPFPALRGRVTRVTGIHEFAFNALSTAVYRRGKINAGVA